MRGGARPGAGRKAIHPEQRRVTLGARVTPQTKEWLADMAEEQGVTIGRIIEELVASFKESSIKEL
jgi:hypothetical protein